VSGHPNNLLKIRPHRHRRHNPEQPHVPEIIVVLFLVIGFLEIVGVSPVIEPGLLPYRILNCGTLFL